MAEGDAPIQTYAPPDCLKEVAHVSSFDQYKELYSQSITEPATFWGNIAKGFHWETFPTKIGPNFNFNVGDGSVFVKWFEDGVTNLCYNCVDRHVANGLSEKVAFYWEGNALGDDEVITFGDLKRRVVEMANVLRKLGVSKGDRVGVYLPMIPALPVTILACARIGAVHSVVFGGFSAPALADRLVDGTCSVVVTADGVFRGAKTIHLKDIVDEAVKICSDKLCVRNVICVRHLTAAAGQTANDQPPNRPSSLLNVKWNEKCDLWYHDLVEQLSPDERENASVEWLNAEDPAFILYTSGSTGKPKGVRHTVGGYMVYAATTSKYDFDFRPADDRDEVYFCTADVGWITGHSYVVYGPLCNGVTGVVFEGLPTYPTPDRYWQVVEKYKVTKFYTAPTAIRALMKYGDEPVLARELSSLSVLATVGEPINPEAWLWYHSVVGGGRCAVVDTFWQTETGGHVITPLPGATPTKPGSATFPFFGVKPQLLNEDGSLIDGEGEGYLVFESPWPGMMRTVHGDHARFEQTYFSKFKGYYCTGDGARRDEDGYFWITGRIDDMLNVSGHLMSTAEIESCLVTHSSVAEAAVVGRPHEIKGESVYAFVSLVNGATFDDRLVAELKGLVRKEIGPFAAPDNVQNAPGLPKTRSGKIMRRVLRKIAAHLSDFGDVSSLADPSVIDQLIQNRTA